MGPHNTLTAQKQKYYTNSNNLNHESIRGEMAEQKETKVSFGKTYSSCCCCKADTSFGSPVSGITCIHHPGYRSQQDCRCSHTWTCAASPFGCGEEQPQYCRAWLCSAEAASPWGQPGMHFSPPPSFSKGPFLSFPPPHSTSPFPHVTGIQGKYFSQTLWSGVSPPAFRRPLYQARSRRAGQTLPQGHRESGLGA